MNLAITTTSARTWKAVKTHYLGAVAGTALAITLVVGAASLSFDWGTHRPINRPATPSVVSADQQYVTYYLVGSEAERDYILAGEAQGALERDANGIWESNSSVAVFVARTPDEAMAAELAIYEAMGTFSETGSIVRFVDLLHR